MKKLKTLRQALRSLGNSALKDPGEGDETVICLDSDFVIDLFRGVKEAAAKMERIQYLPLAVTAITVFEVLYGFFRRGEVKKADAAMGFFSSLQMLGTDFSGAYKAAQIAGELARKGQMIEEFDSLIAGSMLANGCRSILTSNVKDFSRIKGVAIFNP